MPKAQPMKETDKLDFIKIKKFCSLKDFIKKIRRQTTDWGEKNLQKPHLVKNGYQNRQRTSKTQQ